MTDLTIDFEWIDHLEKNAALGEMSATVAHEFMNPLGSIKGAVEILGDEFPKGHEKRTFLDILIKEIDRLDRTVRSVLKFGRMGGVSGKDGKSARNGREGERNTIGRALLLRGHRLRNP